MFVEQHDAPPSLRQGDIIDNVFFPLPRIGTTRFLALYESGTETKIKLSSAQLNFAPVIERPEGAKREYIWANVQGFFSFAAVLSQCCDVDKKHPKTSFVLCRVQKMDENRFQNIESLRANVNPYDPNTRAHHQFFFFGSRPAIEGELIADFAQVLCVPWADYSLVLERKRFQLDALNRNKFRMKAGAWFGRAPKEDIDAGLEDPWNPAPTKATEQ
jgi:hypothetical protein